MTESPFLEARGLTKAYGGIPVVEDIDIAVRGNQIRAVIGENGAGKSTLMKMLTGIVQPDRGEIRIRNVPVNLVSPKCAASAGICIVHQELQLVPTQSVCDNLMLVRPPDAKAIRRGGRAELAYVRSITDRVGLRVSAHVPVSSLSIAECQLLQIAKALALNAKTIIFDEPTAALLPAEVERLLSVVEGLRAEGHAILYVSHSIEEILRIADKVSVLRDGKLVADLDRAKVTRDSLILAMVDRQVGLYARELHAARPEVILTARQVRTDRVRDINFDLHAGEIFGFAGLVGSGMQEAGLALCGADPHTTGVLTLDGRRVHFGSPHDAVAAGVVIVPEERKRDGIVPDLSVCENLHLGRHRRHARRGVLTPYRLRDAALQLAQHLQIRFHSLDQPIGTLSGGNQQKTLLARSIQGKVRVLIVASPTRGVDIGAKDSIHQILVDLASRGASIILISPELEEVIGLSHRIAVFSDGRMTAILPKHEATPTRIMELAVSRAAKA